MPAWNRSTTKAAGTSGTNSGSKVRTLTNSAACGRQNSAVANQLPSAVVDAVSGSTLGRPTRSRNFLVP